MASELPELSEYFERANGPDIISTTSPDGRYVKFKYTDHTIYNSLWDRVTLNARGHVFRLSDGMCVCRPWSKFFNFGELFSETGQPTRIHELLSAIPGLEPNFDPNGPREATDKLDGSLAIAAIVDDELLVSTSGSFTAWQGVWARSWLLEHSVDKHMVPGETYMFEIIANKDLHPIRYDYEGCILTGITNNASGTEKPYADLAAFAGKAGIRVTEKIELPSFAETVKYVQNLPANKEGLVVTYPSGFKIKLKGPEFLTVQKLFHSLSEKTLMEAFDPIQMEFPTDVRHRVPEEFKELHAFMDKFAARFQDTVNEAKALAAKCIAMQPNAKESYEMVSSHFKPSTPRVVGSVLKFARAAMKTGDVTPSSITLKAMHDALIKTFNDASKTVK